VPAASCARAASSSAGATCKIVTSRRPLDAVAIALLVLLCVSWGFQQVMVKLAFATFPPILQMTLRSAGACAIVVAWCLATGRGALLQRDGTLGWGIVAGLLFGVEFILIFAGLQWTDASRSAVFIYTAPFFVALGATWLLPDERMGPAQWLGLFASFVGVAIALGVPHVAASTRAWLGDLMVLAGGALWGATTLVIKASPLRRAPPEKVLIYQLAVSAVVGAIAALLAGERMGEVTAVAVGSVLYQTVWVAGFTYVLWFRLLSTYPASPLQAGTSMAPLFGVASAAVVLGEPISLGFGLAVLLVVGGLVLVNRKRQALPPAPE
jgi:drug/metabolite transporter (DMT)-like permease